MDTTAADPAALIPAAAPARADDLRLGAEIARLRAFNQAAAHEMRGAIGALSQLARLAEDALDRHDALSAARHVTVMGAQASTAMSLVGALMSLTQSEQPTICPAAISLTDCAEQALQTLVLAGAARGTPAGPVTISTLPVVWADPVLMNLVFVNLIGNAIKFTRGACDGRVEVFATDSWGELAVCVRDNGVGFAVDGATLFDPARRGPGPDFDGAGLGLSLVRTIVERHGGRAWARSQPGRGAQFFIALPPLAR